MEGRCGIIVTGIIRTRTAKRECRTRLCLTLIRSKSECPSGTTGVIVVSIAATAGRNGSKRRARCASAKDTSSSGLRAKTSRRTGSKSWRWIIAARSKTDSRIITTTLWLKTATRTAAECRRWCRGRSKSIICRTESKRGILTDDRSLSCGCLTAE